DTNGLYVQGFESRVDANIDGREGTGIADGDDVSLLYARLLEHVDHDGREIRIHGCLLGGSDAGGAGGRAGGYADQSGFRRIDIDIDRITALDALLLDGLEATSRQIGRLE